MRRLATLALLFSVALSGCTCTEKPSSNPPPQMTASELQELMKANPDNAKCSAFQIVEENGKRRLDCVMKQKPDAGAGDAGAP